MPTTDELDLERIGPILYARGGDDALQNLSAIVVWPQGEVPPPIEPEEGPDASGGELASLYGETVWLYDFALPAGHASSYRFGAERFEVAPVSAGDMRIAYVSCNGQESGDLSRDIADRDAMWSRLVEEHRRAPFALLLQGGDQLYADDVEVCHEEIERWSKLPFAERGEVAFTPEMADRARRFYFDRYRASFRRPAMRELAARVPSVMMWDDHDVFDGWGSYPESFLESPVARGLYAIAREMFLLFQLAARDGDMPAVAFDGDGTTLGLGVRYPNLTILAPDLRSERRLRRVMGYAGWSGFTAALAATPERDRLLVMSSVPALGPRLSWIEAMTDCIPGAHGYEDDLRDQWQSRAHREEWIRFLKLVAERDDGAAGGTTFLSGEIHLATRGELSRRDGGVLHQLVSSGISHPAPSRAYAKALGLFARLGESPLPRRRSRLKPLPGRRGVYTSERNYLVVSRANETWRAEWELEKSGRTPALTL